jgi:hypothetical protein
VKASSGANFDQPSRWAFLNLARTSVSMHRGYSRGGRRGKLASI